MKLLALRAAGFRRFLAPVALDGFDAGVNVIAGPNELGKSTLFHALEAAFLLRHATTGAALELMRPRSGGEPLVEVDFEAKGGRWRIRKQFGRGKSAVLTDLTSGKVLARAAEAEEALSAFTGSSTDTPGRAGLVWVRQQRALLPPDPDLDPATGKAKERGEKNALLGVVSSGIDEAFGSCEADGVMARVSAALLGLVQAERGLPKKGGPYDAAIRARDLAQAELDSASRAAAASEARLEKIASLSAAARDIALQAEKLNFEPRIAAGEQTIAEAAQIRARRDILRAELSARESETRLARQEWEAEQASVARRANIAERLATARALESAIGAAAADLNGDAATPAAMRRLIDLNHAIRLSDAEQATPGAVVEIALEPRGEGKVKIAGTAVAAKAQFAVSESLAMAIEGIGAIRVTAAGAERVAAARRRGEDVRAEFARLLSGLGAASFEEAALMGERRNSRAEALDRDRARLSGLAPGGSSALERELEALALPRHEAQRSSLETKLQADERAVEAARQAFAAADAAALDDTAFRTLVADHETLKREAAAREAEARRLEAEIERLRSEQAGFDEDGRAGDVEKAQGLLARGQADVTRTETEVKALRFLLATLKEAAESGRSRYLEPVASAIAPYLEIVFPGAALGLRDGFALEVLSRAGEREEFAILSDGTREQLAVLVRMGFAKVLADRGAPVPLILDDPLVYSDDARLAAMCRALEEAGHAYQVILLTCRQRAFEGLEGQRLEIRPWEDA